MKLKDSCQSLVFRPKCRVVQGVWEKKVNHPQSLTTPLAAGMPWPLQFSLLDSSRSNLALFKSSILELGGLDLNHSPPPLLLAG